MDRREIEPFLINPLIATSGEFKKAIEKGGFVKTLWCRETHCEEQVKVETGATIRIVPFKKENALKCIYCGKEGKEVVYFARAY